MSCRDELKQTITDIQESGGVIEQLEIAENVQQELIGELVAGLADGEIPPGWSITRNTMYGITIFEGYAVTSRPAESGVTICYR